MTAFSLTTKPFSITRVYDILLRGDPDGIPIGLYHLHIAAAEQLCRLHYSSKTLTTIKARLCLLEATSHAKRHRSSVWRECSSFQEKSSARRNL